MVGFFSAESFKATKVEDTAYKGCLKCNAYKFCNNPKLPPFGLGKKDIYILLSEPTKNDDNIDLKAQYYTRLKETFKEVLDLNIEVDCVISHAVKCYSKDVKVNQIENCRKYVFEDIKKHKPKLIYAVGATAMQVLFGDVWKGGITDSIDKWTGYVIPHRDLRAWVCPIHTPQYVSMMEEQWQPQVKTLWKQNIIKGYEHLDKYVDTTKYEDLVKCLTKEEDVAWVLERWLLDKPKYIAFDYETTGIKPREDGHRIVIVSMCDGAYSYSFPYPKKENTLNLLKRVLTDREIGKIAHNLPYEDLWTVVKQNIQVRPWTIDTCLGSHLLDNRKGVVGLKFQTFVRFGIGDYSSHVENYLKAKPVKCKYNDGADWEKYTSANNINDIDNLPLEENLMYCGLDSLFTYKLAMIQMQELKSDLVPRIGRKKLYGYDLYHKGQLAYRKMADNGLRIDKDILVEKLDKAIEEQKELREKLLQQPFFVEWQKWKGKDFNLDSGDQLGKFLYDIKGYKCKDFTDKGGYKTDEEALEKLELDELKDFIQYKKLDKIVNTYLKPIYFEMNKDGRIHPFFNLNNVSSFRSSSSNPNFQNLPKNKGFMKDYIRSVVFPHKGQLLAEVDFSALEVYIGCCYHNDMQMLKYLEDSTADMHRDLAVVLWLTKDKDCDKIKVWEELGVKPLRTATKGVISFPIQYGSYYKSMAADGWEQMDKFTLKNGVPLREHIEKNMGIKTYEQWEQHVKSVEDYYWGDLFASYGAWKKKNYKEYQTNGYVDNKMGLRCRGYMKRNQVGNFPIQGSASSVLMYSVIKLQEWLESEQKKSKICCQIHDSIVLSLEPNEVWEVLDMAHYIMTKMTKEQYSWIDVPLRAEADIGEIDGSWCTLKEMSWEEIKEKFGGKCE